MFSSSLFEPNHIDDVVVSVRKTMCAEIDALTPGQVAQADIEQLSAELAERYKLDCPVLGEDVAVDPPAFAPDQFEVAIAVYIPFQGDPQMFRCHGRSHPVLTESIDVRPDQLVVTLRVEKTRVAELAGRVEALVGRIREGLQGIEELLKFFNPDLKQRAATRLRERQAQFSSHDRLVGELAKTGFRLRRREDAKGPLVVPVRPKVIEVRPSAVPGGADPEPELALADYDAILQVIRDMVTVFERSPSAFRAMDEEQLRTILLVALNGVFKGSATGETFNGAGKTDILVRVSNDNIFIAECLVWDGPEHFRGKLLDQLFRYSTWRDSKLAAIVFNRRRNFTDVVRKMREVAAGLDNRLAEMPYPAPTGCRHRMRRADDPGKQFVLTCLAFDVPS